MKNKSSTYATDKLLVNILTILGLISFVGWLITNSESWILTEVFILVILKKLVSSLSKNK